MLETARLRMLPWVKGDEPLLAPLATDPTVMLHINGGIPWTEAEVAAAVERQVKAFHERGFCRWRLERKDTGQSIGFCGPGILGTFDAPEVGWWLAPAHWGFGFATEAGRVAVADALTRCDLERLISVTVRENVRSLQVMARLGFRFEREAQHGGRPHMVHTLTHDEWRAGTLRRQPDPTRC